MKEKFYFEEPSLNRKNDVIDYMSEQIEYNSDINGCGCFDKILDGYTYKEMLDRNMKLHNREYARSINRCPSDTYFLIRESDNKLVGMLNFRYELIDEMKKFGGNIGYGIRPTERRKGYNKINLYLGLLKAKEFGFNKVKLSCDVSNIASSKTIEALGGMLERCEIDPSDGILTSVYWIDVNKSLDRCKNEYFENIIRERKI